MDKQTAGSLFVRESGLPGICPSAKQFTAHIHTSPYSWITNKNPLQGPWLFSANLMSVQQLEYLYNIATPIPIGQTLVVVVEFWE